MKKEDVELLSYIKVHVLGDICFSRPICRKASHEYCHGHCLVGRSIDLIERLMQEGEDKECKK